MSSDTNTTSLEEIQEQQKDLTLKQARFLQEYIATGNATEAAMRSYDLDPKNPNDRVTAATIGYQNIRKLQMADLMEAMGLTKKALLQTVTVGMVKPNKAETRRVPVKKTVKRGSETVEEIVYEERTVEVPDYAVRHKYLETALKVGKMIGNDGGVVNKFDVDEMTFVWNGGKPEAVPEVQASVETETPIVDKT